MPSQRPTVHAECRVSLATIGACMFAWLTVDMSDQICVLWHTHHGQVSRLSSMLTKMGKETRSKPRMIPGKKKEPTEQGIASKSPCRTHRKPYNQSPWPLRFLQSALIGNWSSGAVDVARSACHPSFQNLHRPPKRNDGVSVSSLARSIAGDCSGKTSPTRLPGMPQAGSALSRTRREMKAGECKLGDAGSKIVGLG